MFPQVRQIVIKIILANDSAAEACARFSCHAHVSLGGMLVRMVDSDAVRSRRKRLHAQGDHSMCRHLRDYAPRRLAMLPAPGGQDLDPVVELRQLAADALADYRANPGTPALLREARLTLQALMGVAPDLLDDPLDELRQMVAKVP
jgi:hypothetical protein